ncbi:hypothetical protein EV677_0204 [Herminiimonas fonticola]|uniref:Uncharacterized protein n=1 Tax=Herminiimonas fonticola TaxID=303380 RepID=A0A4R6GHH0_9BURK|nr:hypothetical protein Hfont_0190 [Herminiimonas fonticola]TDN93674.1 hypothetical protein EV677_0204 [Herminiimonas fonticola]
MWIAFSLTGVCLYQYDEVIDIRAFPRAEYSLLDTAVRYADEHSEDIVGCERRRTIPAINPYGRLNALA